MTVNRKQAGEWKRTRGFQGEKEWGAPHLQPLPLHRKRGCNPGSPSGGSAPRPWDPLSGPPKGTRRVWPTSGTFSAAKAEFIVWNSFQGFHQAETQEKCWRIPRCGRHSEIHKGNPDFHLASSDPSVCLSVCVLLVLMWEKTFFPPQNSFFPTRKNAESLCYFSQASDPPFSLHLSPPPKQSPIQESLIEFTDSGLNKTAADAFQGESLALPLPRRGLFPLYPPSGGERIRLGWVQMPPQQGRGIRRLL